MKRRPWIPILATLVLSGCSEYHAPGGRADFAALDVTPEVQRASTPAEINTSFDKKPLANFPAVVAVVRIQQPGYESMTAASYGAGKYSIVTSRDVESDAAYERLRKLPQLRGIATLNRLLLPAKLETDHELRQAAAQLQCDMLLVYTFDTTFHDRDAAAPISIVTLGLSPTQVTNVVTTASAVLLDTRNGFVYGVSEASAKHQGLATAWNTASAIDGDRKRTETEAFDKLVAQLEQMWTGVVADFGPNAVRSGQRYPTGG